MSNWKKKLTDKELAHQREMGAKTFEQVKNNVLGQEANRFPCWECVNIGRKLGIAFELKAFHEANQPTTENQT